MKQRRQNTLDAFLTKEVPGQGEGSNNSTTSNERQSQPEQDRINTFDSNSTATPLAAQVPQTAQAGHSKEVDQNVLMLVAPYDVSEILIAQKMGRTLSDANKVDFLDKCWRPAASDADHLDKRQFGPKKTICFQLKWLDQRRWLAYSAHIEFRGGWCLSCLLFLTDREKESLGVFVKTPFTNYNKSKEKLDARETYHKRCIKRTGCIWAQIANIENRIDTQINTIALQNVQRNKAVLLFIKDAVMLCVKQQLGLRGHRDDDVQFDQPPTSNEGNFVSIVRLLAGSNPVLKEYLTSGPRNARYTSKTIQNELIEVIADLIRDYFRQCLEKSPHFALIGDETTSQGREVLSVCLRLLDFIANPSKPTKREVLIDMCDLRRITGEAIATAIRDSLERQGINLANCRGQAYDTTASMSSDKKGVQAEIGKFAPDAEYQGCCLHSLNLVICQACKIPSIQNMMDSCRELYSFFDNSPKRQKFFEVIIHAFSPENKKKKLKSLCKTRWIERHSTFETIFDLYEYIVITLNEICEPTNDDRFYQNNETWDWDAKTKTMANGLRHIMSNFGHIVNFVCAKELLEPMRPLVCALQGELMEVYFGFQKIEEVICCYQEIRSEINARFQLMYEKVKTLAEMVGSTEQRPRVCSRQRNRENCPAETVQEYWRRTVAIPFVDVICSELQCRFSEDKRAHYELCALIPQVIVTKRMEAVVELGRVLHEKWNHVMPLPSAFDSELLRWMNYWKRQPQPVASSSVTSILATHADNIFFPNVRELLKILAVLPIGSTEAERSFSCIRRIHTWLRSSMTTSRLSNLAVAAMHSHTTIPINRNQICERFMALHSRRMNASSLFIDN